MATKFKTQKNLKSQRSEYNTYYGDFRGVDFSSDHSLVSPNRFAYLVNMYKDYKSKTGTAIETIPGYRKAFVPEFHSPDEDMTVYGIHTVEGKVLVHAGEYLLWWKNYPYSCGVEHTAVVELKDGTPFETLTTHTIDLNIIAEERGGRLGDSPAIVSVKPLAEDDEITVQKGDFKNGILTLHTSYQDGDYVVITYKEDTCEASTYVDNQAIATKVKPQKSVSCSIANKILVFDGADVYIAELISDNVVVTKYEYGNITKKFAYIPTTYKNIAPGISGAQYEYEQRNLLSPLFKNEFVFVVYKTTAEEGDVNEVVANKHSLRLINRANSVLEVVVVHADGSDKVLDSGVNSDGTEEYSFSEDTNTVTIKESVALSKDDTVIVTAFWANTSTEIAQQITKCTVSCSFDNRIFLSGNPNYPNRVWFSRQTSSERILYFGADDWFDDGFGTVPVTGIVPVADKLLVLKADATDGSSSVYLHSKYTTGDDIVTKAYPSAQGINGIGCVGACANFFDDPVFVSRRGLDSVGLQTISYERSLEHRSTNVDAKLTNMDLSNAFIEELGGYLWLFVDGSVFLADSRQRYADSFGIAQYEWYYLEGIGSYNADGTLALNGKPVCAKNLDDNMYFGTGDGCIFAFNFDKRNADGEIDPKWYTFDGRTILSGCATKMDNCGIPHLTKSTVKKSMVVKIKAMLSSSVKVNVRTNKDPYHKIADLSTAIFTFDNIDFGNFTFLLSESGLLGIREKEKKWVEKQIYLYSDEPMRPFALHYLAYRYVVAGRYKE